MWLLSFNSLWSSGKPWFGEWLVAWWHQALAQTDTDSSSASSLAIQLMDITCKKIEMRISNKGLNYLFVLTIYLAVVNEFNWFKF